MVSLSPLNKKLLRDLWRLRGQVIAIALVIGSGVATLVMSLSTVEALQATTQAYYQRYHFADVFAHATRAPERLTHALSQISGVQSIQTRITEYVTVDIKGFEEPVVGQLMSIPETGQPLLNQLVLRKGRWITPERTDEIILSEPFAEAHQLALNDVIDIIMDGNKRQFHVVGFALSPEFIYSIGPGALMPDDKQFGVMWLSREVMEAAFDLDASFNSVALKLMHNASLPSVLASIDTLLESYGGISAIGKEDQISNWFIMNEIAQQKSMATILPGIFIIVSVFLTNMVLSRLIATERTEIGLLKAFGYSRFQIAWQYTKMVVLICIIGILLGSLLGVLFGRMNSQMYADMFRFPLFIYQPSIQSFLTGGLISTTAVLIGALTAVRAAVKLPPAEAMTPPSPPIYKRSLQFSSNLTRWLDQPTRIALRQIGRWPLRSFLTSFGIALSGGLMIMNLQWDDSLAHLSRVYFFEAQKQDIVVGVPNPVSMRAIHDFEELPGVLRAEPMRMISADLSAGSVTHRGALSAIMPDSILQPIYDDALRTIVALPSSGLVISTRLAQKLGVTVGDIIWIDILEGRRKQFQLPVADTFETFIGMPAFIDITTLNRLMGESPSFEYANLSIDKAQQAEIFAALKNTPRITAVLLKEKALMAFKTIVVEHLMVFITMFVILAIILAFGVVYNSTRIALSERARELATLRVLGFSKGEISYVLLGEVMFLVLFGLPLGSLCGWLLVLSMASAFDTEMFRIPLVIEASTFGTAALLVILAAAISAAIVRRRVDKLDLIKVLKTRE